MHSISRHISYDFMGTSLVNSSVYSNNALTGFVLPVGECLNMSLNTASKFILPEIEPAELGLDDELTYISDIQVVDERIISLVNLKANNNANGSIYLIEKSELEQKDEYCYSIDVQAEKESDYLAFIDKNRAKSFRITVHGMIYPENRGLQIAKPKLVCCLRQKRESNDTGRMICLMNQKLNL